METAKRYAPQVAYFLLGSFLAVAFSVSAQVYRPPSASLTTGDITSALILNGTIIGTDISGSASTTWNNALFGRLYATSTVSFPVGSITSAFILNDDIVNADINSAAAIAYSKLNLGTSILGTDISGSASTTWNNALFGRLYATSTVSFPVGSITSAFILNDDIVNADINSAAAIAYSKLNLGTSIVNADVSASAAIDCSKLAGTACSGANSNITSLTGLTTALSVAQGGTGSTTLSSNQVLLGNGTSAIKVVAGLGSSGELLTSNGAGSAPTFQAAPVSHPWTLASNTNVEATAGTFATSTLFVIPANTLSASTTILMQIDWNPSGGGTAATEAHLRVKANGGTLLTCTTQVANNNQVAFLHGRISSNNATSSQVSQMTGFFMTDGAAMSSCQQEGTSAVNFSAELTLAIVIELEAAGNRNILNSYTITVFP